MKNKKLEIGKEKKKNYLLKGGMIGAGIYLIFSILTIIFLFINWEYKSVIYPVLIYFPSILFFNLNDWFLLLINLIFYFVVGVLIGWVYKKYKMSKEK